MGNRCPLTQEEKERIYRGKLKGQTLSLVCLPIPLLSRQYVQVRGDHIIYQQIGWSG